jgi:hypothetical protein
MSNKLNAEELAKKLYPDFVGNDQSVYDRIVAAHTIREVAQPIANERDELRKSLAELCTAFITHLSIERDIDHGNIPDVHTIEETAKFVNGCIERACSIVEKYPKP